ncbi:nucleoside diphosphate kinase regulator [Peredibacter starrii]|uniref:Nucleoside diphosphate kinase regulator n=1 Tax=Peredibacter starrii TaxID=28202 RepID=A0AAX4HMI6_9BACT|nr:nucleoside diphosphate kinase regulator [Peredibacter starrii]WPU64498.1 nucleoside diphosphate kinase regulator [Peredibacter starrii]
MIEDGILITEKDLLRIKHVLSFQKSEDFENLELELDRASIINDNEVPSDLVTMNSKVKFLNVQENKEMTITLVYPSDANFSEGKISVLASLGSAIIGLRVGQEINWMFPDGKTRTLKILEVLYQPEASGDWHL